MKGLSQRELGLGYYLQKAEAGAAKQTPAIVHSQRLPQIWCHLELKGKLLCPCPLSRQRQ